MPRFAANLAYLFTERPLIERFAAAAAAGFQRGRAAVALRARAGGDQGRARPPRPHHARPQHRGRAGDRRRVRHRRHARPRAGVRRAVQAGARLRRWRSAAAQIHCLAGKVPPEQRPAAEAVFMRNLASAADAAAAKGITLLIEPINTRDRPDYFLTRAEHAADIIAKVGAAEPAHPVRLLSCADRRRRSDPAAREICRWSATCRSRRCRRATSPTRARSTIRRFSRALDRLGYGSWIGCEYRPRGRTEDGLGWARSYGIVPRSWACDPPGAGMFPRRRETYRLAPARPVPAQ